MSLVRPVAIHLPQFHPFAENDEWWGKGFTEWTNVTKAKPLFKDHYQPQLPTDLGFYDLRLEEARIAQIELAKQYGIYGFCYYHYWFNGKRLLHEPLDRMLANKKEDFPFMLCWANENWTRRWDGLQNEVLIKQNYSIEDDRNHIRFLCETFFKDPRYIKVDGKPVVSIYMSNLLPNVSETLAVWRTEAKHYGIELYICRFEGAGVYGKEYMVAGFDAAVEFQPFAKTLDDFTKMITRPAYRKKFLLRLSQRLPHIKEKTSRMVHRHFGRLNYEEYLNFVFANYEYPKDYKRYPCVMPSWDNTARRKNKSFLFYNSSPEGYKKWLRFHKDNFSPPSPEENFIFINAWNEWAEGNHLEPCTKWQKQYLEVTKEVMNDAS